MASRVKKLFHRKKDVDAEGPSQHAQAPLTSGRSDPALRSSRYESTHPAALPLSGDYPVKGNESSIILQQGRRSSVTRSRRNSGTFDSLPRRSSISNQQQAAKYAPQMISPSTLAGSNDPYQQSSNPPVAGSEGRHEHFLPQEFSDLILGNVESPTQNMTQTVTTTRTAHRGHSAHSTPQSQGYSSQRPPQGQGEFNSSQAAPKNQEYTPRSKNISTTESDTNPQRRDYASGTNDTPHFRAQAPRSSATSQNQEHLSQQNAGCRTVNEGGFQSVLMAQAYQGDIMSNQKVNASLSPKVRDEDDADLARQNSIPRKRIGKSAAIAHANIQESISSGAQSGHSRQQSTPKPLPSIPAAENRGRTDRHMDSAPQPSGTVNRSRPMSTSQACLQDAQDILDRAKANTYDTTVVESVAPAVVHEKIRKDIHHVREEVITREIHNHDVYHRIQPIIDVEVLPPRHFLPVEGGGLVEISAQEVPGRGSNWVVAETASQIPSDQPSPHGTTQFTARKFVGREGDAVKYMSAEGYEVKEETWIHPPELEEGARLTGQSWPMVIGKEPPG